MARKRARYFRDVSTTRGKKRVYSSSSAVLKRLRTGGAYTNVVGTSGKRSSCKKELKYKDITSSFTCSQLDTGVPHYELLPHITQGSGDGQREGREIHLKKIDYLIKFVDSAVRCSSIGSASDIVRAVLFHDTQANKQLLANAPSNQDILIGTDWTVGLPNPTNSDRIKILRNWSMVSTPDVVSDGAAGTEMGRPRIWYKKGSVRFGGNGKKIVYAATTGSGADMVSDNIYFSTRTGINNFTGLVNFRVWYYD